MINLNQVCDISSGHPFRGRIEESNESNVKVVQMKDVSPDYNTPRKLDQKIVVNKIE